MKEFDIYAVGNALVDIEYHSTDEQIMALGIDKGVMTLIDEPRHNHLVVELGTSHEKMACGGSAANTTIAAAQLGAKTHFDCRVSNDMSGQFYASDLKQTGVNSNLNTKMKDHGITGKCLVFVTPDTDRTMNTYLGVTAELDTSDIDRHAISASEYIYVEGYLVAADGARKAAIEARRAAEARGVKTSITLSDPNMVNFFRDGLIEMIGEKVDLLFANEEEAIDFTQTKHINPAIEAMKQYAHSFAITRGDKGAVLFDGEQLIDIAPNPVKALDTLGAGDMFAGAFLYGITAGMGYAKAGQLASMASAQVVTRYGPRLDTAETLSVLKKFNAGN